MAGTYVCVCGHRRSPAHPKGGECVQNVGPILNQKRCKCRKFQEAR